MQTQQQQQQQQPALEQSADAPHALAHFQYTLVADSYNATLSRTLTFSCAQQAVVRRRLPPMGIWFPCGGAADQPSQPAACGGVRCGDVTQRNEP